MKISYKVGLEDIVAFNLYHLSNVEKIKKQQFKGRIILSSVYGIIGIGLFIYEPGYWPFSWLLIFFAILWFTFYPKVWEFRFRRKMLKAFKERKANSYELNFTPEGIFAKSDEKSGYILWPDVKKIVQIDQYIFIYLSEDDGIIIPRASLVENISWEDLNQYINASWEFKK